MIGDAQDLDAGASRTGDELLRRAAAV
jgi:hypothetical protein